MNLAQLRKILGLGDDVSDADVIKKAEEKLGTLHTLETEKQSLTTQLSQKTTEVTNLTTELNAKKQEVVTLSQSSKAERPTSQSLYFAKSAFTAKRDQLVAAGTISKATADKIEEKFCGKDKLGTITLSKSITDEDIALCAGIARGLETLEVLEGTKPGPEAGDGKTGDQGGSATATTVPNTKAGDAGKEKKENEEEKTKTPTISQAAVQAGTRAYAFPKRKTQTA